MLIPSSNLTGHEAAVCTHDVFCPKCLALLHQCPEGVMGSPHHRMKLQPWQQVAKYQMPFFLNFPWHPLFTDPAMRMNFVCMPGPGCVSRHGGLRRHLCPQRLYVQFRAQDLYRKRQLLLPLIHCRGKHGHQSMPRRGPWAGVSLKK